METVKFKGHNAVLGKNQPEYLPLPAYVNIDGTVTSCWKLSWKDLFTVIFTRRIYLQLLTFHNPIQPQKIVVENPVQD